jgi:hypothetical protein
MVFEANHCSIKLFLFEFSVKGKRDRDKEEKKEVLRCSLI